tara:strand:- start:101 stop:418 length:318 start_codon:yes stop_codon:yes gene_type:complete
MKVAIGTIEVDDEQRRAIRRELQGKTGRAAPATRDEVKQFASEAIQEALARLDYFSAPFPVNPAPHETMGSTVARMTGHHADDCHDPDCPMHGVDAMPWLWTEDF